MAAFYNAKTESEGTMEWAKEKVTNVYGAMQVKPGEGLEAEIEAMGKKCHAAFYIFNLITVSFPTAKIPRQCRFISCSKIILKGR